MKILFLIFLVIPLLEIYLLIEIGSAVGAGTTIFLVVFTALLGAVLVRAQGFSALSRAQAQLARAQIPATEIMEGLFLFIAGALLLTPGFFTDTIGFILLTPPLRRFIIHNIINHRLVHTSTPMRPEYDRDEHNISRNNKGNRGNVIDADFKDID